MLGNSLPASRTTQDTSSERPPKYSTAAPASAGQAALAQGDVATARQRFRALEGDRRVSAGEVLPVKRIALADLLVSWRELNSARDSQVDLVSLGNPHFSLGEFAHLAQLCRGRTRNPAVSLVITCGRAVLEQARDAGHLAPIEAFGAVLVTDTCWCMLGEPVIPPAATTLMTNSGKYAHYAPGLVGRKVHFASLAECVDAACSATASGRLPAWLQPATLLENPAHV